LCFFFELSQQMFVGIVVIIISLPSPSPPPPSSQF